MNALGEQVSQQSLPAGTRWILPEVGHAAAQRRCPNGLPIARLMKVLFFPCA